MNSATHVYQECNRKICEICFDQNTRFCLDCSVKSKSAGPTSEYAQSESIFKLLLVGFFLILLGVVFVAISIILPDTTVSLRHNLCWSNAYNTRRWSRLLFSDTLLPFSGSYINNSLRFVAQESLARDRSVLFSLFSRLFHRLDRGKSKVA